MLLEASRHFVHRHRAKFPMRMALLSQEAYRVQRDQHIWAISLPLSEECSTSIESWQRGSSENKEEMKEIYFHVWVISSKTSDFNIFKTIVCDESDCHVIIKWELKSSSVLESMLKAWNSLFSHHIFWYYDAQTHINKLRRFHNVNCHRRKISSLIAAAKTFSVFSLQIAKRSKNMCDWIEFRK